MMRSFFDMEGPVFVFLSKVADFMMLNILFLLCCLPVFTIGASYTALSYVTLAMKEGKDVYIVRSFFKSFKQNFKQATVIWLLLAVLAVVLFMDYQIARAMGGVMYTFMTIFCLIALVFWLLEVLYVFPLLARFENTIRGTMKNGMLVAMGNAPKALLMIVVMAAAVLGTLLNATTLSWGILLWLMFGFSVLSYINSSLQMKIIHRLMPEETAQEEEADVWTLAEEPQIKDAQTEGTQTGSGPEDDFLKYI